MNTDRKTCLACGRPLADRDPICYPCSLRPGLSTPAEILDHFSRKPHRSDALDFEDLCARHPELASELRRLRESWMKRHSASKPAPRGRNVIPDLQADSVSTLPVDELLKATSTRPSFPPGGRYEVRDEIARGGMGVIYEVQDRDLKREVAMKVIGGQILETDPAALDAVPIEWIDRFVEEAKIMARLDHPNIVPVYEIGVDANGRIYFTMKRVNGRRLNEIFELAQSEQEGWNVSRAVSALVRVCEAMAHAHECGVVHRDLKPQNILVGRRGEVYVMDWGIAQQLPDPSSGTVEPLGLNSDSQSTLMRADQTSSPPGTSTSRSVAQGGLVGTPAYMSPEHLGGKAAAPNPAADVYSLGAILYELLMGRAPYTQGGVPATSEDLMGAVQAGPPRAIHRTVRRQSPALVAICEKAMSRDPAARYPAANELAEDLQAWLDVRVVRAYRAGFCAVVCAWLQRNRLAALSLGIGIVLSLASAVTMAIR